ncbi:MAG: cupin domain-containing protein [Anaerolineaceae bacterium]
MENSSDHLSPRSISIPSCDEKYKKLLGGPPDTQNLVAGYVVLSPGESVGRHTTGASEEMIIPLSGEGELQVPGLMPEQIHPGMVLYNPPNTPHDVINTSDQPLRYIYVVARTPAV